MIVMKFGGTSVESAAAITRVAGIVKARVDRHPIVVVSAMGKTTNKLLAIAQAAIAAKRDEYIRQLHDLRDFHSREARQIVALDRRAELDRVLDDIFEEMTELVKGIAVLGELTPRSIDAISSYGERLSSHIVSLAFEHLGIPSVHVDSRRVMVTDNRHTQAAPLYPQTYRHLEETVAPLAKEKVVVMGGFIASTTEGITSTLGRGGSDFTASIVGAGVAAEEIQIWTDVDGMLTADPRIVAQPRLVSQLSFAEASELAYFGAKVLHPSTILPAVAKNIPVRILNSRRPENPGTMITAEGRPSEGQLTALACKRDVTVVDITSTRMLGAHGFLRRLFEVFERFKTAVDVVTTSEVSVSVTVDDTRRLEAILDNLRNFAEVSCEREMAIICAVGENLRGDPTLFGRAVTALDRVPLRLVSQAASRRNITFVLKNSDVPHAMTRLHEQFFQKP
jgi:aspartate kinase